MRYVSLGFGVKLLELLIMFITSDEVWENSTNPDIYYAILEHTHWGAYVLQPCFTSFIKEIKKSNIFSMQIVWK